MMCTLIVLEWSLSMFESIDNWIPFLPGSNIDCISQQHPAQSSSNLSLGKASQLKLPTRLDLAFATIKSVCTDSREVSNIPCDGFVLAAFGIDGLFILSSSFTEFQEKILAAFTTVPPSKVSHVVLMKSLQTYLASQRNPIEVIIFSSSSGNLSSVHEFQSMESSDHLKLLPFSNESSLNFVSVSGSQDKHSANEFYLELIKLNRSNGEIIELGVENSIDLVATRIRRDFFEPFLTTLKFGELSGRIRLLPNPKNRRSNLNFPAEVRLLGIMEKAALDKLYPTRAFLASSWPNSNTFSGDILLEPHFAPLLHASLRMMSGKVIWVSLESNWMGYLETIEDAKTKRKSSLMLHVFPEGSSFAPGGPPVFERTNFIEEDLPSYVNPTFSPAWTSAEAEQSDFSRIIRMARKLPDKLEAFYKELNKARLHALSTCDFQYLDVLADVLFRESQLTPNEIAAAELSAVLKRVRRSDSLDLCCALVSSDGREFPLVP